MTPTRAQIEEELGSDSKVFQALKDMDAGKIAGYGIDERWGGNYEATCHQLLDILRDILGPDIDTTVNSWPHRRARASLCCSAGAGERRRLGRLGAPPAPVPSCSDLRARCGFWK